MQAIIILLFFLVPTLSFLFVIQRRRPPNHFGRKPHGGCCPLPPGPTPWPVVGSLVSMHMNRPVFRWITDMMDGQSIGCIRLGGVYVVPVNCPELAREFLKKHDADFATRPLTVVTEHSTRGFLTVAVSPWSEQWKKMRRVLASVVMNSRRLLWQQELRIEEADHLVRYIHNQCKSSGGANVDVRNIVRHYCGNVIRRMLFGKRFFGDGGEHGGPGVEEEEHVESSFTVLSLVYAFCVSDYLPWLRFLDLEGHEKTVKKCVKVVNIYHDPVIDERMQKWRNVDDGACCKEEPVDLLDVLISLKGSDGKPLLTADEIKAQTAELVYATVDNPSNAVEWALAEILNQPEIMKKAVDELDRVVGKDRLVQESDFPNLTYIKACARESMRLHPVAPFNLPHVSTCDTTVAGYLIPKGSHVILSRIGLGRNPKVWDDPLRFEPERHLKVVPVHVELAEPDLKFISFSTGRRGCMGGPLGTVMTYMLLARLLQAFNWSLPPGVAAVELSEEDNSLFMAKPLHALVKPRLSFFERSWRNC